MKKRCIIWKKNPKAAGNAAVPPRKKKHEMPHGDECKSNKAFLFKWKEGKNRSFLLRGNPMDMTNGSPDMA